MATHFNIAGELTQELLAAGDGISVSKISLTNTQKVSKCKVDLYIEKKLTGKFYLLKGVELPIGTTLIYKPNSPVILLNLISSYTKVAPIGSSTPFKR